MKHLKLFEGYINEGKVKSSEKVDIYRDKDYIVVAPLSFRASCKYGAYSKWCISAPSNDDIWDEDNNPKIVIIIQRNLQYSEYEEENISKFNKYHEAIESGEELLEEEMEEYLDLADDLAGYDLRKIAVIKNKNKNHNNIELWDMNNIHINDKYGTNGFMSLKDLPIDNKVVSKVLDYLE